MIKKSLAGIDENYKNNRINRDDRNYKGSKNNSEFNSAPPLKLINILLLALFFALACAPAGAAYCAPDAPPDTEEAAAEYKEAFLTKQDYAKASALLEDFLKSLVNKDKSYERYATAEIGEDCVNNFYMIDRNIIKNYKRSITVNNYGEASCIYDGDGEVIKQEFTLIKNEEGALKINSISEKRYIKMNSARRSCHLNTRAVYKAASLLPVLYENMRLPETVGFELLKKQKLLKAEVKCPQNANIFITVDKNSESQNYEVIARCAVHGDFFELYKLDDKISADYEKYNRQIDKDEEAVMKRIGGTLYEAFLKIQPVEDAFYEQYERQNPSEMLRHLKRALVIDKRLGNMYITIIRAFRAANNEKSAREIYDMAVKVYPRWEELKNVFNEKNISPDDGGDDDEIED